MKKIKKNRLAEVLDNILGDDEASPEANAEAEGYVDPRNFLEARPLQLPKWIQECDDWKLVVVVIIEKVYLYNKRLTRYFTVYS